jgi:hypothetical protein
MSEKPDMDVKNYSIEDLLKILNIDLPMNQEELLEHGKDFINKYINEGQPEAAAFFTNALKRLLENFKAVEAFFNPIKNPEEQYAENTLKNQYYNDGSVLQKVANTIPNRQNNVSTISENHSTQAQGRLISQTVHAPSLVQGNINPTLKNKYISWVNIDSHYREIRRRNESTSCNFIDPSGISIKILDSSTDYTFNLSEPLTNVTSLSLKSMEIPMNAYYPVSERYGTSSFDIVNLTSPEIYCVTLPSGFYPSFASGIWDTHSDIGGPTLVSQINYYLVHHCGITDVSISISPNTQRTKFINTSLDKYNIIFYSENGLDCSSDICRPNNSGARIDSNLGWLLGFRQPQYILDIAGSLGESIISESIVNPWGTRYLLLEVDDLNRNRTSGNLVSMSSNKDKLKLPEYYTKTRQIYPACSTDISGNPNPSDISGNPNPPQILFRPSATEKPVEITRPCRTGTPATTPLIDGNNNLTKAQKYTITEIINRRKTQDQSRYHSPVNTNILFRTPVNRDSTNVMTGNETAMIVSNDAVFDIARHYFGPVTIKTLKIKLLNDKGYPVELNDDWSFSLMAERLYQY